MVEREASAEVEEADEIRGAHLGHLEGVGLVGFVDDVGIWSAGGHEGMPGHVVVIAVVAVFVRVVELLLV